MSISAVVSMTTQKICKVLEKNKFFGLIKCDIEVPPNLRDIFSEMSPIFKNIKTLNKKISEIT